MCTTVSTVAGLAWPGSGDAAVHERPGPPPASVGCMDNTALTATQHARNLRGADPPTSTSRTQPSPCQCPHLKPPTLLSQGSYYVLGLPFALVHGREFVAWRQLDPGTLELAVQDVSPQAVGGSIWGCLSASWDACLWGWACLAVQDTLPVAAAVRQCSGPRGPWGMCLSDPALTPHTSATRVRPCRRLQRLRAWEAGTAPTAPWAGGPMRRCVGLW